MFLDKYSTEAFADYCAGINHVLPTNGNARFSSGLSVKDFIKLQTYMRVGKNGIKNLSSCSIKLAEIEGLYAHKKSIEMRLSRVK